MQIDAVVFDYGNVLNEPPPAAEFQKLARVAGFDNATFLDLYWRDRLEYDRGNPLNGPGYWQGVAEAAGREFSAEQINQLIYLDARLWEDTRPILMEWVKILRKQGVETAILSNMPYEIAAHLRQTARWLTLFNHLVFSGELGMVKPEARIYEACLEGLGAKPQAVLFLDDHEENVEGARGVGMQAVRFTSIPQLTRDVQIYGLRASLDEAARSASSTREDRKGMDV